MTVSDYSCLSQSTINKATMSCTFPPPGLVISCSVFFLSFPVQCDTDANNTSRPILPWRGTFAVIIIIMSDCFVWVGESKKAQQDEHHHDDCTSTSETISYKKNEALSESSSHLSMHTDFLLYLWQDKALMNLFFFFRLDGADVRCLPPRCSRELGLQEPGSHHYPRRGKGPGVNHLVIE